MASDELNRTKLLLVDDHGMVRSGLKALLERERGLVVVGEAANGRSAVQMAGQLTPNVVIMDLHMMELNGIEATRQIIASSPGVKVIALSASSDDANIIEMLRAGAAGYVLKDAVFEELITAIKTVLSGSVYLSPPVASLIVNDYAKGTGDRRSVFSSLSPREREVLQLISEGKATKEIAMILKVSLKTAETHRRNLMEKLNVDSVAGLTRYAISQGLTTL